MKKKLKFWKSLDKLATEIPISKIMVKNVMSKGLLTIKPTLSIGETGVLMKKHRISKLPVIDNGDIIGYVTKSDLLEELNEIYYQNRRLLWTTVIISIQFIVIAILLFLYINK